MKLVAALLIAAAFGGPVLAQRPVYQPGDGVTLPRLVKEVKPTYTRSAKDRKVQGKVLLESVVEVDGRIQEVVVLESLDKELDQRAIAAIRPVGVQARHPGG